MSTCLELLGEFEDIKQIQDKINKKFILARIEDVKLENFISKHEKFISNFINFLIFFLHFVMLGFSFYSKYTIEILVFQSIITLILGIISIVQLKIRKNKIFSKLRKILSYIGSIINNLTILIFAYLNFKKFMLITENEYSLTSQIEKMKCKYYLLGIFFIKSIWSFMIFRRLKFLLIGFCISEIILLFIFNYILSNEFLDLIIFNVISYIITYCINDNNENIYMYFYFFRKSFKKVYCEFSNKFNDLGIKNFLFNGDNIIDFNKAINKNLQEKLLLKTNLKFKNSRMNFKNTNSDKIAEELYINNKNLNPPNINVLNVDNQVENLEDNKNNIKWLPTLYKNYESKEKMEFLKKLVEYDQEYSIDDDKKEINIEQSFGNDIYNINRINENESANLKFVKSNSINYNKKISKKTTLLDILQSLKIEFETDKKYENVLDMHIIDFPKNPVGNIINEYINRVDSIIINSNKNKKCHLNVNYTINSNIQNYISNLNNQSGELKYKINNFNSYPNLNHSSQHLIKNNENNSINFNNNNIINNKNYIYDINKNDLEISEKSLKNFVKENAIQHNNNIENKAIKFNSNKEIMELNNLNNNLKNKVNYLKLQSEAHDKFIYIGKFIIKDFYNYEFPYDCSQVEMNSNLMFRSIFKVFFKKIIFKKKIYFELLITEDIDIINIESNQNINESNNELLNVEINKKEFGKLAHEIKTPLNAIIGLINELMNKGYQNDIFQFLTSISGLANYLIFLVSDLTQYCNNSSYNDIQIFIDKININEILVFCFEILKALLMCKNSDNPTKPILHSKENISLLVIKSDEVRLKQILLNVISNAVKFTKSGTIEIKAKIKENLNSIKVSIIDTGIGIKEEDLKKLFNEKEKIKEHSILNRFGSGFGLAISKALSEKLNINLKFKSTYQVGSKFSLYIPFEKNKIESGKLSTPAINIIKSNKDKDKSISLGGTTIKNSYNPILYGTSLSNDRTESSGNLNCYNVITERLLERRSTKKISFKNSFFRTNSNLWNLTEDAITKSPRNKISIPKTGIEKKSNKILDSLMDSKKFFSE